jgi:hypothetical protein
MASSSSELSESQSTFSTSNLDAALDGIAVGVADRARGGIFNFSFGCVLLRLLPGGGVWHVGCLRDWRALPVMPVRLRLGGPGVALRGGIAGETGSGVSEACPLVEFAVPGLFDETIGRAELGVAGLRADRGAATGFCCRGVLVGHAGAAGKTCFLAVLGRAVEHVCPTMASGRAARTLHKGNFPTSGWCDFGNEFTPWSKSRWPVC